MSERREVALRSLRRLLANGRLAAVPRHPADQALLVALAASRLDPDRDCAESEVNDRLKDWLETISEPFGIDHVTLRRMLVDSRLLARDTSGSTYRIDAARSGEIDALRGIDPADVIAQVRAERDERKRRHAA